MFKASLRLSSTSFTGHVLHSHPQAQAEKLLIEGQSSIDEAKLKQEAENIVHSTELDIQKMMRDAELSYQLEQDKLELDMKKRMADIEVLLEQNLQ